MALPPNTATEALSLGGKCQGCLSPARLRHPTCLSCAQNIDDPDLYVDIPWWISLSRAPHCQARLGRPTFLRRRWAWMTYYTFTCDAGCPGSWSVGSCMSGSPWSHRAPGKEMASTKYSDITRIIPIVSANTIKRLFPHINTTWTLFTIKVIYIA